ncbi:MAG: group II intron reverse transcriptase/maturase, partial [Bacteroidetes bacterium RIFCSPHIGHO2_02_FULL_44_7]
MNVHETKSVPIEFSWVAKAYQKVRRGGKSPGIDEETWQEFEKEAMKNLYVIWNRLASGSYHPKAVRGVEIPKKEGKKRKLGIPTVRDRIAQQVVKDYMEKRIDHKFHKNSYGYRPMKSAHGALKQVRENCFKYDWVIDMDIQKFFDEIDHELMQKAVSHVMEESWVQMYVKRWLEMPRQEPDGSMVEQQGKGTPQGGVISPLLANLYLHFALDLWLSKNHPEVSFVRYADDMVIHCRTKEEAETILEAVKNRLKEVK